MKIQTIIFQAVLLCGLFISAHSHSQTSSSSPFACPTNYSSASSSSAPAATPSPLTCAIGATNAWNTAYQMEVIVTNTSDNAIDNWEVLLMLPESQQITQSWNAILDVNGPLVNASNLSWNARLQPGQSTSFGITGSHSGNFVAPTCTTTGPANETNRAPEVHFTVDIHGPTLFVDARDSTDPDGDELDFSIKFDDEKTISHSNAWHTFKEAGDYTITVTVTDGEFTETQSQIISVSNYVSGNRAPIAKLALASSGGHVIVSTALSFDEDGDPLTFSHVTKSPQADYVLYIYTVSDGTLGDTTQAGIPVHCNYYGHPQPTPHIAYEINGLSVRFDGSDSWNGTSARWDFGDGNISTKLIASHTYASPGEYNVQLYIGGIPVGAGRSVRIQVGNQLNNPPQAALQCEESETAPGEFRTQCSATGSSDPDGDALSFNWDMGDGSTYTTTAATEIISHQYAVAGQYEVTLDVSDGEASTSTSLTIYSNGIPEPSENTPPVACFLITMHAILPPPMFAYFNADCSTDADGDSLSYFWEFSDGATATGVNAMHTFALPGLHGITLTVSDGIDSHSKTALVQFGPELPTASATCEYIVTSEWASGFTGLVRITNISASEINGWSVNWQYTGNNRLHNPWNTQITGDNPYFASNLQWNSLIAPGQAVEFGFQGTKSAEAAEIPEINGSICE